MAIRSFTEPLIGLRWRERCPKPQASEVQTSHLLTPLLAKPVQPQPAQLQQRVALAVAQLLHADQAGEPIAVAGDAVAGEHAAHHLLPRIRRVMSFAGAGLAVAWQIRGRAVPTAARKPSATASAVGRWGSCASAWRWSAGGARRWGRGAGAWGDGGGVRRGWHWWRGSPLAMANHACWSPCWFIGGLGAVLPQFQREAWAA